MKKYLSLLALLFLAGCASTNSSNNSLDNSESENTSEVSIETTNSDTTSDTQEENEERETRTCLIDFTNVNLNKGTQLVGDSNANHLNTLKNYMNSDVNIISSLTATGKVNINQCKRGNDTKSLILGSQSDSGSLGLNFNLDVCKVTVNAEAYWKWIDYSSSYSMDMNSKLHIGSEVVDLSIEDNTVDPTPISTTCTYTSPINSLNIYNEDASGRVIINSIEFTYYI